MIVLHLNIIYLASGKQISTKSQSGWINLTVSAPVEPGSETKPKFVAIHRRHSPLDFHLQLSKHDGHNASRSLSLLQCRPLHLRMNPIHRQGLPRPSPRTRKHQPNLSTRPRRPTDLHRSQLIAFMSPSTSTRRRSQHVSKAEPTVDAALERLPAYFARQFPNTTLLVELHRYGVFMVAE